MENETFNLALRRFLKEVGVSSQQEIERIVRENGLAGTNLRHVVDGKIDLG